MIKTIFIYIIKIYKLILSPILGPSCRYLPTCSEYFIDCLNEYGVIKGIIKGTKEFYLVILLGGHGYDPVKKGKKLMDLKNTLAAVSLSAAVIVLYGLFFAPSPQEKRRTIRKRKK